MIYDQGAVVNNPVDISVTDEGYLMLGKDVNIRPFVTIVAKKRIGIGEGTQIAGGCRIVDFDHDIDMAFPEIWRIGKMDEVLIGKYCWLGANSVILKGVKLGDGCVVGAGSVVLKGDYPDGAVIVGNPARILRIREP